MKLNLKWLLVALAGILISACSLQKSIDGISLSKPLENAKPAAYDLGNSLAKGALAGIDSNSKKTIANLLNEINVDKLDPEIKKLLLAISTIGDTTSLQISKVGNNIHWQIGRVNGDISIMAKTIHSLTGTLKTDTRDLLSNIITNALDSLQTQRSKAKIDTIVSNLLDSNTKIKAQQLVTAAMQPTIDSLSKKVHGIVREDLPFVQKQAVGLLIAVGIMACLIIAFCWYERNKYAKLAQVLTLQIDRMPKEHQDAYDSLTQNIKSNAQNVGVQPLLSKLLVKQGIN